MRISIKRTGIECNALSDTKCYMLLEYGVLISFWKDTYTDQLSPVDLPRGLPAKFPVLRPKDRKARNVNNLCINWR